LNNKHRITLVSFLAYFVMSGMLAPMGIISGEMSEHFGLPVTEITARFGWLTIGILTGAIVALVIFDWIRLRKLLMLVYGIILASLSSLVFLGNITLIGIALGVVGACCGVGLAGDLEDLRNRAAGVDAGHHGWLVQCRRRRVLMDRDLPDCAGISLVRCVSICRFDCGVDHLSQLPVHFSGDGCG
jgi:hypothetical protein